MTSLWLCDSTLIATLAQVEVNLGISGQRRLQSGRSVLDSINSRLGAVLDNDLVRFFSHARLFTNFVISGARAAFDSEPTFE